MLLLLWSPMIAVAFVLSVCDFDYYNEYLMKKDTSASSCVRESRAASHWASIGTPSTKRDEHAENRLGMKQPNRYSIPHVAAGNEHNGYLQDPTSPL